MVTSSFSCSFLSLYLTGSRALIARLFEVNLTRNAHTTDVPAAMTLKPGVVPVKAD